MMRWLNSKRAGVTDRVKSICYEVAGKFKSKLVNRLILFISSVLIVVISTITFISYYNIQAESKGNTIANTTNNLKLVNGDLQKYFSDIDQLSLPQNNYDDLINSIWNDQEDFDSQAFLEDYLTDIYFRREDINAIYLHINSDNKCYYILKSSNLGGVMISYDNALVAQPWYKTMLANGDKYFEPLISEPNTAYSDNGDNIIAYNRIYTAIGYTKPLAELSMFFSTSSMKTIINEIPTGKGDHVVFMNADGLPYYTDNMGIYNKLKNTGTITRIKNAKYSGRFVWEKDGKKYMLVYNVIDQQSGRLVKLTPYSSIYEPAAYNKNWSLTIGFIVLGISIFLVVLITRAITRPLGALSKRMVQFSDGDFNIPKSVTGQDEISQLENEFSTMVTKINDLINDKYKMKLVEKSAVLKALEAQLNPHFLYNSLQAISTMALKNDASEVSKMINALALSFRYCINGAEMVRLRDEISHIENYLILQKARYGSRLLVEYDIDENTLDVKIPKLSIQTLVENSIKHAVEKVLRDITIHISVHFEGPDTRISVIDDGPGISRDRLEFIRRQLDEEDDRFSYESIGLKNLDNRLKLMFNSETGLNINSYTQGLEISFLVPTIFWES